MNASREVEESLEDRSAKRDARWIAVGFSMSIFVVKWEVMRGLSPSPVKVEESVSGALLGLLCAFATGTFGCCSTFGLKEKSDDMIWVG